MAGRFEIDPLKLVNELERLGKALAQKRHEANILDKKSKIVLGRIASTLRPMLGSHSAAMAEATASKEYEAYVDKLCAAEFATDLAETEYEKHKTYIDLLRSVNATNREQLKHLSMTP